MREFTIGKNDAGQRLDRFVAKNLPLLPPALLQKYIRLKRIKVNGKGSKRDVRLNAGDVLQLYINDEFFDKPSEENMFLTLFNPQLDIEGVVLTMLNGRTKLGVQVVDEVKKFFGQKVYNTIIPRNVRLGEAPSYGQPINIYDGRSAGALTAWMWMPRIALW